MHACMHMTHISKMKLVAILAFALLCRANAAAIRGLNPSQAALYSGEGGVFSCLDGSKTIPFSRVNDDYCDCADGSDEPGWFLHV